MASVDNVSVNGSDNATSVPSVFASPTCLAFPSKNSAISSGVSRLKTFCWTNKSHKLEPIFYFSMKASEGQPEHVGISDSSILSQAQQCQEIRQV